MIIQLVRSKECRIVLVWSKGKHVIPQKNLLIKSKGISKRLKIVEIGKKCTYKFCSKGKDKNRNYLQVKRNSCRKPKIIMNV